VIVLIPESDDDETSPLSDRRVIANDVNVVARCIPFVFVSMRIAGCILPAGWLRARVPQRQFLRAIL
jgi:hypothetical protein